LSIRLGESHEFVQAGSAALGSHDCPKDYPRANIQLPALGSKECFTAI